MGAHDAVASGTEELRREDADVLGVDASGDLFMKLYIVVGRINGQLGFANRSGVERNSLPFFLSTNDEWNMTAFKTASEAMSFHDDLKHGIAKLCKVVEIEIPDEE